MNIVFGKTKSKDTRVCKRCKARRHINDMEKRAVRDGNYYVIRNEYTCKSHYAYDCTGCRHDDPKEVIPCPVCGEKFYWEDITYNLEEGRFDCPVCSGDYENLQDWIDDN